MPQLRRQIWLINKEIEMSFLKTVGNIAAAAGSAAVEKAKKLHQIKEE